MSEGHMVDNQKEKIYSLTTEDDMKKSQKVLRKYVEELIKRRRYDPENEGIQSTLTFRKNCLAAKINENDGVDSHAITQINLNRFLTKRKGYYKNSAYYQGDLVQEEEQEIDRECVVGRLMCDESDMKFICLGNVDASDYTKQMLGELTKIIDEKAKSKEVNINFFGIRTKNINVVEEAWSKDSLEKVMEKLGLDYVKEEQNTENKQEGLTKTDTKYSKSNLKDAAKDSSIAAISKIKGKLAEAIQTIEGENINKDNTIVEGAGFHEVL